MSKRPRSRGEHRSPQTVLYARSAASTARSTSFACPAGIRAITLSVAGARTSIVSPFEAGEYSLLMNRPTGNSARETTCPLGKESFAMKLRCCRGREVSLLD